MREPGQVLLIETTGSECDVGRWISAMIPDQGLTKSRASNLGPDRTCTFPYWIFTFSSEKVLHLCKMGPPPPVFVKCPRFETL